MITVENTSSRLYSNFEYFRINPYPLVCHSLAPSQDCYHSHPGAPNSVRKCDMGSLDDPKLWHDGALWMGPANFLHSHFQHSSNVRRKPICWRSANLRQTHSSWTFRRAYRLCTRRWQNGSYSYRPGPRRLNFSTSGSCGVTSTMAPPLITSTAIQSSMTLDCRRTEMQVLDRRNHQHSETLCLSSSYPGTSWNLLTACSFVLARSR